MCFPFSFFKISGHSMEPLIKNGSKALVFNWAYRIKEPRIGEIVVFYKGKEVWIKRIKKVEGKELKMEGDNKGDSLEVGLVRREDLIGQVIWAIRP